MNSKKVAQDLQRSVAIYGQNAKPRRFSWWPRTVALRVTLVGILLAACGFGGLIGAKHVFSWFRQRQLDRNLEAAQVAARLSDWPRARDLARSVLLGRSHDFEAFRVWHKALGEMEDPRSYLASAALFGHERAEPADRLEALKVMCLQAPQALALSAYASLDEAIRSSSEASASVAEVLLFRGDYQVVEGLMRDLPDLDTHPRARLCLLRALCAMPTQSRIDEARKLFADLVRDGASDEALQAMLVLGDTPGALAPGPPLPLLPSWVSAQPRANDLHHLTALNPQIAENGEGSDQVMEGAVKRFLQVAPGTLGTWLIRHNRAGLAAEVLEEAATLRPDAFTARLHALIREKRIDEVRELLASPPPNIDKMELELIKVATARMLQDPSAEMAAWNRALYQALLNDSKNAFIEIARHAEVLGASSVVERAWVSAVRVGWGRLPLYNDLLPIFASRARQSRTDDLVGMYSSLIRYEPGNIELQNNLFYLGLLHGTVQAEEALRGLELLAVNHPELPELYSGAAVAALMAGKPAQALAWLPTIEDSPRASPVLRKAVRAVALLMQGDEAAGTSLLAELDWSALLSQERVVFRKLLLAMKVQDISLPELPQETNSDEMEEIERSDAWKRAMDQIERSRVNDTLPALPAPRIPTNELKPLKE
jgi:hypothetical protein